MKHIASIITILTFTTIGFSQKIKLTDKKELIKELDNKEFNVGPYGKMIMYYDDFDKDFNKLKFNVEFMPASSDKKKKIKLATDIVFMDGFYNPSYMTSFTLGKPGGSLMNEGYAFPTNFILFENGELYYADKTSLSMTEFIKAITTKATIQSPKYVLCK